MNGQVGNWLPDLMGALKLCSCHKLGQFPCRVRAGNISALAFHLCSLHFVFMQNALRIVVVEQDHDRAIAIVDALKDACQCDVLVIVNADGLARQVAGFQPDIVLIDIDNPTRDMMEEMTLASGPLERPVAMFVSAEAGGMARAAIEAGVSAYVVDGLAPARVKSVIDTAIARFSIVRQMREELAETRRALEERKVIDRAKGLLMKAKGIDEEAAYALLRKTAMDQGRRVADVAEALVTAAGLLG
ncbi:response regulator receiver and ANTAR domain protein [Yoonia rosea]|uniref:Response regulator receiver and ANTAR domain protein n=2 Tax=Yoonia rosea TaxID=287098 RepID=A0A1R3W8A8_9RHOB|nr:response regulator receiver and ANTAR domain protein [Yoonia rosea]